MSASKSQRNGEKAKNLAKMSVDLMSRHSNNPFYDVLLGRPKKNIEFMMLRHVVLFAFSRKVRQG